jgi:hypothetical protein
VGNNIAAVESRKRDRITAVKFGTAKIEKPGSVQSTTASHYLSGLLPMFARQRSFSCYSVKTCLQSTQRQHSGMNW